MKFSDLPKIEKSYTLISVIVYYFIVASFFNVVLTTHGIFQGPLFSWLEDGSETYLEPVRTSTMEFFAKIVSRF